MIRARLLRDRKGLTFVELVFALMIMTFVITVITGVYIMAARMYKTSHTEAELYAEGAYVMDVIQKGESGLYGIMKGRRNTVVIAADQRAITFSADKNANYTTSVADDVQMSIAFDNGDGNDATLEDNVIVIDPDTTVNGDELEVGRNIGDVAFTYNGGIVTVDLTIERSVRGDSKQLTFSRNILMRN